MEQKIKGKLYKQIKKNYVHKTRKTINNGFIVKAWWHNFAILDQFINF